MSIEWGTIISVGIGAAIGTVGSICTTYFAHRLSRQRERDAFQRRKQEDASIEQADRATRLGSVYVKALESAYIFRSCEDQSIARDFALEKANYHQVKAELNLMCQDESIAQAWKDYLFQSHDDRKAVSERKKDLIRQMSERLGTVSDPQKP